MAASAVTHLVSEAETFSMQAQWDGVLWPGLVEVSVAEAFGTLDEV